MAIVAEGSHGRIYITPDDEQRSTSIVDKPENCPSGVLSGKCRVNVSLYGFDETADLFTNRQLTALTTFSTLVAEVPAKGRNGRKSPQVWQMTTCRCAMVDKVPGPTVRL